MKDNWLTEGPRSQEFATQLMELMNAPYGVFAPNGTLALALGLLALDISASDEVIVPNSTFVGSATAVLLAGAKPVFVDIDAQTLQIDVAHAEQAVTPNTAAIMPVHLMGVAADMDAVMAFARHHKLKVIEDAAQGIGVTHNGRHVGTIGDVGCFSFFADKTITTGEGGFIACRTPDVYERLRRLRNQGRVESGSFIHPVVGFNFRITDMQAAVGLAQLKKLEEIIARKQANQALYKELLSDNPHIRVFEAPPNSAHVPFRCVLMCDRAFELADYLSENGIATRRFFYPLHKQPCFADISDPSENGRFRNSISAYEHGLLLPVFPAMRENDVARVASMINRFHQ
ncbi:MAG: DegT/DnrJ/EryC1/StrS family aminotransferase [Mycobacteriaceae bacterium]|nr:DegT/DnrJ/EryC1/StrS family aminotransferase [Mycobacteriaceae bacterium]